MPQAKVRVSHAGFFLDGQRYAYPPMPPQGSNMSAQIEWAHMAVNAKTVTLVTLDIWQCVWQCGSVWPPSSVFPRLPGVWSFKWLRV